LIVPDIAPCAPKRSEALKQTRTSKIAHAKLLTCNLAVISPPRYTRVVGGGAVPSEPTSLPER
jgi:hypothetical protein